MRNWWRQRARRDPDWALRQTFRTIARYGWDLARHPFAVQLDEVQIPAPDLPPVMALMVK